MEEAFLLVELAGALCAAGVGALLAQRAKMPPMVGYVLAGVVIGPFTPGFVGDEATINSLADIGVVLLMFAIGARLPLHSLRRVGLVATGGALLQVASMIGIGALVGRWLGFRPLESVFLGAVVSNSSSTVITKLLGERGEIDSSHGRLALAWSSVQDLSTVILIVVLSSFASGQGADIGAIATAVGRAGAFLLVLVFGGGWLLERLFRLRTVLASREVFVVALAAGALAIAHVSTMFGLSLALGAFAAGMVVAETDVAHHALAQITPVRDVFAALFFVAVGMLVHPEFVVRHAPAFAVTLGLVVVVKALVSGLFARAFGTSSHVAILAAVALGQSAEFSFLLARVGATAGAVTKSAFNVMLSACVVSVVIAPFTDRFARKLTRRWRTVHPKRDADAPQPVPTRAVVCGFGRVGATVCAALADADVEFTVIDDQAENVRGMRDRGIAAVLGDAAQPLVLDQAGIASARLIVIAIPDALDARAALDHASAAAPDAIVVARTHSMTERDALTERGAARVFIGEIELARAIAHASLDALEVDRERADAIVAALAP